MGGVGQVTAAGPMRSGNRCVDGGRGKEGKSDGMWYRQLEDDVGSGEMKEMA